MISKSLAKTVFKQTYGYLFTNILLYSSQCGFRKGHSTDLASTEPIERVSEYLDCGKLPISVFVDLSKAFDTLSHSILLDKTKYYGFSNTPLNWFSFYLQNRMQFVDFDGTLSTTVQGWGLLSKFPPFRYFPNFSTSPKYMLAIGCHFHIWQVSPQLSCGDTCQIWIWFE